MKTTTITVKHVATTDRTPVYCKYQGQFEAQDAYIELDCETGVLLATWNSEIGNAIPFSVYHGHDRRYGIPNNMNAADINSLLDEIAPLAQRIVDGYDSRWDGDNMVADLNDDAQAAENELINLLPGDDFNGVEVWDVDEYLFSYCHLTEFWNNQTLEEAVKGLENSIADNIDVDGDFEDALIKQALWLMDARPDQVNRNHVKTLWKRGDVGMREVREWLEHVK